MGRARAAVGQGDVGQRRPSGAPWGAPATQRRDAMARSGGRATYDRPVPAPALLALAGALALLVLIPTRRLYLAGWRGWSLVGYFVLLLALGLLVAELRGPARFLVPILVIAYLAPFVTARAGVARLLRRGGRDDDPGGTESGPRPPPKDVTPPDQRG
jgi:hypothetical protein